MEPHDLAWALWRQRLLVALIFVVTAVAVTVGVVLAPKSYTATAVVSATAAPGSTGAGEDLDALRGTLGELANSRAVVEDVQQRLPVDRSLDGLRRSISGEWVAGTVLIQVVVSDSDPEVAARIANLVAARLPLYDPTNGAFQFTTTTPAQPPVTYSSPNILVAIGVGLVLAAVLSAVAALARDRRRSTVDDAHVAEEAALAPLLAHVSPPRDLTSLPALYPGTAASDVFRHLRRSLEAETRDEPVGVVVVAGVNGDEVHVWLGANLAISLANVGRRVLLVDARLDNRAGEYEPSIQPPDTIGLHEVLEGADLDGALSPGPVERLTVLPAGQGRATAAEALIETRFESVMAAARRQFDVVVVLPPPLDVCDDARVMAAHGGSMVLAVPERMVSVAALRSHAHRARSVGARVLGVVLVGRRAERLPV